MATAAGPTCPRSLSTPAGPRHCRPSEVSDPVGMACATSTVKAERLPLDVYLMLDASYSMLDPTQSGASKWDAVKTALRGFMMDPQSAGMGLGMQVFPQVRSEIPEDCFQDTTCAAFGPCLIVKTCSPGTTVRLCETNAGCAVGQTCLPLGGCTQSDAYCAPVGNTCGAGVGGTPLGNRCEQIPGYCIARDLCDSAAYAAPSVPIAALPGAATMLSAALDRRRPEGRTTLGPALAGAIAHAKDRMMKDPSRKVAVVLASDGLPVVCSPMDVRGRGGGGRGGRDRQPVGGDVHRRRRHRERGTGGAGQPGPDLPGGRHHPPVRRSPPARTSSRCSWAPWTASAPRRSPASSSCRRRTGGGRAGPHPRQRPLHRRQRQPAATIVNVPNAQACDDTRGGWYYDVDPTGGGKPASIVTCPATCDRLKMDQTGKVDIVLGCRTIVD